MPTTPNQQEQGEPEAPIAMSHLDGTYQQLGCLGKGGFGSVFLAKKRSGRTVALKCMRIGLDDDEDEVHSSFTREVDAVLKLDCTDNNGDHSIVYFRDWFRGPNFACIVMQHADGGTLAREIETMELPYTERRICWYALQLSDALRHAHSRGVFHHDVKSQNVLIDATGGGKLLLADFGSALAPGEEGQGFTKQFASPELLAAYEREDFAGLQQDKVDGFGLGCIMLELICKKRICDFDGDATLGQYIWQHQSAEAALSLGEVQLPWLSPQNQQPPPRIEDVAGYSYELGHMIKSLLEPNPNNRASPSDLPGPLRGEQSPLLADYCPAALAPEPGAPVTVDNIQLGMFVQRGVDWNDGETDGGLGSVGVVVKLDPDANYTEVAFPFRGQASPKPICYRIGAGHKFELQVGPTPLPDFVEGTSTERQRGIIYSPETAQFHVGQSINENCIVVGVDQKRAFVAVAPVTKVATPTQPVAPVPELTFSTTPRKPMPMPITWNTDLGLLVPLQAGEERQMVLDAFYSDGGGGMDIQQCEVVDIQAVQSPHMWEAYAKGCEEVAVNNWSNPNQKRLFHATGAHHRPEALVGTSPEHFCQVCVHATASTLRNENNELVFSETTKLADRFAYRNGDTKQVILSRVALGRIDERSVSESEMPPRPPFPVEYHSVHKRSNQGDKVYSVRNPYQVYPEFVITYKNIQRPGRRTVRARRPSGQLRVDTNRTRTVPTRPPQIPSPAASSSPMVATPSVPNQSSPAAAALQPPVLGTPAAAKVPKAENETTPGVKNCVVCWERDVNTVNVPCGHASLCQVCATKQGLRKLKYRCPECRQSIRSALRIFDKILAGDK